MELLIYLAQRTVNSVS